MSAHVHLPHAHRFRWHTEDRRLVEAIFHWIARMSVAAAVSVGVLAVGVFAATDPVVSVVLAVMGAGGLVGVTISFLRDRSAVVIMRDALQGMADNAETRAQLAEERLIVAEKRAVAAELALSVERAQRAERRE